VREGEGIVRKYDPAGGLIGVFDATGSPEPELAIDLSNDHVYVDHRTYVLEFEPSGALVNKFGEAEPGYSGLSESRGIAVRKSDHTVFVMNQEGGNSRIDTFAPTGPITIPDVTTGTPDVEPADAVLRGTVNGDGIDTTDCQFEWGPASSSSFPNKVECAEGKVFAGASGDHAVSAAISGLAKGTTYHFRLTAKNSNNVVSAGAEKQFTASGKPVVLGDGVSKLNTDGVQINVTIDPNGGVTKYHVEWGTEAGVYGNVFPVPDGELETKTEAESFSQLLTGLAPETEYHFRVVASNDAGTTTGTDRSFKTFALPPPDDPCENALVRKQTGAALLLDCRAYELVSAADQGGYDVESSLLPNQSPLQQPPTALDRVLYSLRYGALPNAGSPTTYGHDPYVASRTSTGWQTEYLGLPADGMPSAVSYGSPLLGAADTLEAFAFGGPNICDPCFADGSTNVPLRIADGNIVEGMAGSEDPGPADPVGEVRVPLSADGSHFVFGSDQRFEPDGNDGNLTIYARDLLTGVTEVVSKTPAGATMDGSGIAELDISNDGSRILLGRLVGADAKGNRYFDLYMHDEGVDDTIEVADTAGGVIYNGMTDDGGRIFFTTPDQLADDSDASPDLFRADVGSTSAIVSRVSTGSAGTGQTDACTPATGWNEVSGAADCGVLTFAGGAAIASEAGSIYFLSPEKLDGASNGDQDQANLYVADPGGSPKFVATIDSASGKDTIDDPAITRAREDSEQRTFGDFQVTPNGSFAAFSSARSITGFDSKGHYAIYRYESAAPELECISCGPSGTADVRLTESGLNLSDDGRVFFTSSEQFVLRDTNEALDAYEYEQGNTQLISSGTNRIGSSLLGISGDGVDVYFFTRDTLSPEDQNGSPIKIYDARALGGFLYQAPSFPCAASDECHGPGTQAADPPVINTVEGSGKAPSPRAGTSPKCKRGFVKRHGKCVKRKKARGDHRRHKQRKGQEGGR
jgi:hypothetical protein